MYILTRYVVWEVLKFFLAALVGLTLIFTLVIGISRGLGMGLPPSVLVRLLPLILPEMLGITLPVAMLFAVNCVFGRMTGTNEIVAIKSLGISPMAVVWPVLVLASFLSLGTIWMYEIAATWCRPSSKQLIFESAEEIAYSMLRTNHSCSFPPDDPLFCMNVKGVEGRTLIEPWAVLSARPGQPKVEVSAERGSLSTGLSDDQKSRELDIVFFNPEINSGDQLNMVKRGELRKTISLAPPPPERYHRDWMATCDIASRTAELEDKLRKLESLRDAKRALGEQPSPTEEREISNCRRDRNKLRAEPYRRWSNGFTCLCFAIIGIPVAMIWRHADVLTNFFTCFLPILSIYYPLLMLSEKLAIQGSLPPATFWLGNALLFVIAAILLRGIVRH
jgi:lipopolysaccharide export system permease protein